MLLFADIVSQTPAIVHWPRCELGFFSASVYRHPFSVVLIYPSQRPIWLAGMLWWTKLESLWKLFIAEYVKISIKKGKELIFRQIRDLYFTFLPLLSCWKEAWCLKGGEKATHFVMPARESMLFPAAQYFNLTRQGTKFQEIHGIFQMLVHNWDQSFLLQDTETLLPSKQYPFPPFFFFLCFVGVFVCLLVFISWQTCESWKGNRNKIERESFLSAVCFRCNDYGYNQQWLFTVQYFWPQLGSTLTCSYTHKHC